MSHRVQIFTAFVLALCLHPLLAAGQTSQQAFPLFDISEGTPVIELDSTFADVSDSKQNAGLFAHATPRNDRPCLDGVGRSQRLEDGTLIWEIGYHSPGAISMSVTMDVKHLPENSSLTVFGSEGSQAQQISIGNGECEVGIGSPILDGDMIVVQYIGEPIAPSAFEITSVCRGFRHIDWNGALIHGGNKATAGDYGSSNTCEVVAACNELLTDQRRAVCRIMLNNNMLGTGTLINNTAQDGTPYIITSAHVIPSLPLKACKARFCFEETTCNAASYNLYSQEISGATLISYDERADMALLKLSEKPNVACRPFWAGWNVSETPTGAFTCYHHPYGDAKKVSLTSGVSSASYTLDNTNSGASFRSMYHWLVSQWSSGATEAGSSGSALLDKDGLIVGCLTGGRSTCASRRSDYFWKLYRAMGLDATEDRITLRAALDPLNKGVTSLAGADLADIESYLPYEEVATYNSASEPTAMSQPLTMSNTHLVQKIANPQKSIKVSCISISASELYFGDTSNSGPTITVRVVASDSNKDIANASYVSKLCNLFSKDKVGEFIFDEPVEISTPFFYVVIDVDNMQDGDFLFPLAVVGNDGTENLMVSAYYQTTDSATDTISNAETATSKFSFQRSQGCLIISGESIAEYSVWDTKGTLFANCDGINSSHVTLPTDGWPRGLYILRAKSSNGTKVKMRFLVK